LKRAVFTLSAVALLVVSFQVVQAQAPAGSVAATVNGQAIPQSMVDRALDGVPADKMAKAREEILTYLIETAMVDQYLVALKIAVEEKEVDARLVEIEAELKKRGETLEKTLEKLKMTAAAFRTQLIADLRWEKFAIQQSTDANLQSLFQKNPDMFDGSQVRARHILLSPGEDAKAQQAAVDELAAMSKQVEATVAAALAKLPASAAPGEREIARLKETEEAFGAMARAKSTCPSKRDGGDLNWFPRVGSMVEAFAAAAFALKTAEMSPPIKTQFGYHLILCTGRKPGQTVQFAAVKDEVREVYCNKLREAVVAQERPKAKIVMGK